MAQQPPFLRAKPATYPATLVERLARTIAGLAGGPAHSITVVGDQPGLAEALAARGAAVLSRGAEPVDGSATLAVVRADAGPAAESLEKLANARVFAWQPGEVALGGFVRDAAPAGYFRSTRRLPEVRGASCVLLDGGDFDVNEIVARYETILSGGPDLQKELLELRHQLLASRDHVLGAEAELSRVRSGETDLNDRISEIYGTTTWRVGRVLVAPLGRAKRALRR